jgi:hypothetical protein
MLERLVAMGIDYLLFLLLTGVPPEFKLAALISHSCENGLDFLPGLRKIISGCGVSAREMVHLGVARRLPYPLSGAVSLAYYR